MIVIRGGGAEGTGNKGREGRGEGSARGVRGREGELVIITATYLHSNERPD